MNSDIQHLVNFRQSLHQNPELSGNEEFTAEALKRTLIRFQPDDIIDNIGGFGVAIIFKSKKEGPTVLFRSDMDALPIHEQNEFDYASRAEGIGHQCGHDGHMAILVGLAEQISKNRPDKGKVVLLFQPAEETGEGAMSVINDPNFYRIKPDVCFALHNVPGYAKGSIVVKPNTFASASQGLHVKLKGKTSHAAEPDKGNSPALAMAQLIQEVSMLPKENSLFTDFVLTTIVHARLGEKTFGTSPGYAEILITLRAFNDDDMDLLLNETQKKIEGICNKSKLEYKVNNTDIFPSTQNNAGLTSLVLEKASALNFETFIMEEPFAWSEDFSQFSQNYKSVIFGLGAGVDMPKLHNANYDFPDDIIPYGVQIFNEIFKHYLK